MTDRSWEEQQLTTIISRAAESAIDHAILYERARRIVPAIVLRNLGRYLLDAMDWFDAARPDPLPEPAEFFAPADSFEHWVIQRWLKEIRSDEFQNSTQGLYLRGQWERGE